MTLEILKNPYRPTESDDWLTGQPANVQDALDKIAEIVADRLVPIGTIVGWHKSLTGVPSLPGTWVECDGSTVSDSDSPLDGESVPDLNGDERFLRGNNSSGGGGGQSTVTLTTANLPAHTHSYESYVNSSTTNLRNAVSGNFGDVSSTSPIARTSGSSGSGSSFDNNPLHFDVVWIIRIK